jgi:hypothetical protein
VNLTTHMNQRDFAVKALLRIFTEQDIGFSWRSIHYCDCSYYCLCLPAWFFRETGEFMNRIIVAESYAYDYLMHRLIAQLSQGFFLPLRSNFDLFAVFLLFIQLEAFVFLLSLYGLAPGDLFPQFS